MSFFKKLTKEFGELKASLTDKDKDKQEEEGKKEGGQGTYSSLRAVPEVSPHSYVAHPQQVNVTPKPINPTSSTPHHLLIPVMLPRRLRPRALPAYPLFLLAG